VSKQIATTAESSFEPAQFCNDSEQVFSNRSKCVPVRNIGCLESVNSGARHREVAVPKCVLKKQKPPPINSGFVLYPIDLLVGAESNLRSRAERATTRRPLTKFSTPRGTPTLLFVS
jgi:hypothetical protein